MRKEFRMLALIMFALSLGFAVPAHAYIDPATTSYLIQIVAGVVISAGVVVGVFWKKIRAFFQNLRMKMMANKISKDAEKKK